MSTNSAPSSAPTAGAASSETKPDQPTFSLPSLGGLDEDDEFEEFDEQDWPSTSPDLSTLTSQPGQSVGLLMNSSSATAAGAGVNGTAAAENLWQDSWDDDTVEDDFSLALRAELEKQNGAQAMST
ncbi:hypothetical protein ACQY0O_002810 [Thecaphora frezii]